MKRRMGKWETKLWEFGFILLEEKKLPYYFCVNCNGCLLTRNRTVGKSVSFPRLNLRLCKEQLTLEQNPVTEIFAKEGRKGCTDVVLQRMETHVLYASDLKINGVTLPGSIEFDSTHDIKS